MKQRIKQVVVQLSKWSEFVTHNSKAWTDLKERDIKEEEFLLRFFYPLIGLGMIVMFFSNLLIAEGDFLDILPRATKEGLIYFLGMFVGIFFLSFILDKVSRYYKFNFEKREWIIFSGVNFSVLIVVDILYHLISQFIFIKMLHLFLIYSVFNGVNYYFKVDTVSANSKLLILIAACVIYLTPLVINKILLFFI